MFASSPYHSPLILIGIIVMTIASYLMIAVGVPYMRLARFTETQQQDLYQTQLRALCDLNAITEADELTAHVREYQAYYRGQKLTAVDLNRVIARGQREGWPLPGCIYPTFENICANIPLLSDGTLYWRDYYIIHGLTFERFAGYNDILPYDVWQCEGHDVG